MAHFINFLTNILQNFQSNIKRAIINIGNTMVFMLCCKFAINNLWFEQKGGI